MRRRVFGTVLVISLCLVLTPSLVAAEPGFTQVRSMPTILGVPSTTLEAYASVSCPAPRSCTAVGPGFLINSQSFSPLGTATAVTETNETWGARTALPLPMDAVASTTTSSAVSSVVCKAVGDCTAVGSYPTGAESIAPLVETEVAGIWTAISIVLPGGVIGIASLSSVWCASDTSCVALGHFQGAGLPDEPMVVVETSGTWGQAVSLPAVPSGDGSGVQPLSIACSSTANCDAIGIGGDSLASTFEWTEHAGVWSSVLKLPTLRSWQFLGISIGCPTTTTCLVVGGLIPDAKASSQDMFPAVVTETSGKWSKPLRLPVPTLAPRTTQGLLTSITCTTVRTCEAVGGFLSLAGGSRARPGAFTWSDGHWSAPGMIRGVPLGNALADLSYFTAVACASKTECVALGPDRTSKGSSTRAGAFAATIAPMRPTTAPSPPTSVNVHPVRTGAVVRWSPPVDDGGSQVTLYTVTVSPGGERCATTRLGCRVEGLVAGHLYRASVTDSTVIGTSARTRPISFVPLR